jgi:hypothetical protein
MPKVHTGTLTVSELHAGDGVKAPVALCFYNPIIPTISRYIRQYLDNWGVSCFHLFL